MNRSRPRRSPRLPARPVLIAGPTASGKSALALALAERDGGWVINADALQVYSCWRVLTARPGDADLVRAPHRLYGHVDCAARHSVGAWLREVAATLHAAGVAGARPIVVGGTGLYFGALTEGLADIPDVPPALRVRSEALLRAGRLADLVADLARDDPATLAGLDAANPMRVQRAWEVLTATGRGLAEWRRDTTPILKLAETDHLVLSPDVATLNNNITHRFHGMVEQGALDECARFRDAGGDLSAPSGRAIGAAELTACLDGRVTLAAAAEAAIIATRRYAKRQRTWFRNRMAAWPRIDPAAADPLAAIPR